MRCRSWTAFRRSSTPHEDRARHGRLVAADQRRRPHAGRSPPRRWRSSGTRSYRHHAASISAPCRARPTPRSGWRCLRARAGARGDSTTLRPRRGTHRDRRARSAWPRGAGACARGRAVHDRVSHAVPGVRARAVADPAVGSGYALLRWFHGRAARTLVATPSLARRQLEARGFAQPRVLWAAASTPSCSARAASDVLDLPRPIWLVLRAGRGREGHRRRSSALDLPGTKLVVGDGPAAQ
ncbi:MAG: hypothetical protein MZW92_78600 [Comamonadaceae bacterium]|nr:hypothetical protein [Comamonadaceae bacterium]